MTGVVSSLRRIYAVVRKEIIAILRQPRMLLTLIVGPFLILALVGFGYQRTTGPLKTVFVAAEDNQIGDEVASRVEELGDKIDFRGVVTDRDEAVDRLRKGRVDIVVIVPEEPVQTVRQGDQAVFTVLHNQLDPFEQATITLVARTTIDTVNRRVLQQLVETGQEESEELETVLPAATESSRLLREALERGDTEEARKQRNLLASQLRLIEANTGATETVVNGIGRELNLEMDDTSVGSQVSSLEERVSGLNLLKQAGDPLDEEIAEVRDIETQMAELDSTLRDFQRISPEVLVSPFAAQTEVIDSEPIGVTDFYAPGVMALLLQHLGITFAGLSLVRERALGTPEVFQVAPIRPIEILIGKYIGYVITAAVVAAALSALMFYGFGVPIAGSPWSYTAILALLVLAALGIGFVISGLVDSDIQAVNLSMIVLLLSLFFSGFFVSIERLATAVTGVSWALPITHAIDSLRDVMFRDTGVDVRTWLALGIGSVALFIVAWRLLARRLRAY